MIRTIHELLDAVFKVPTVEDTVLQNTRLRTKEADEGLTLIRKGRFLRHMALSELEAMENWNHQRNLKE